MDVRASLDGNVIPPWRDDPVVFRALVGVGAQLARRFGVRPTADEDIAADAVRSLEPGFVLPHGTVGGALRIRVARRARNHHRASRRRLHRETVAAASDAAREPAPLARLTSDEFWGWVDDEVDRMPPLACQVLRLDAAFRRHPDRILRIAQVLRLTTASARQRLYEARLELARRARDRWSPA